MFALQEKSSNAGAVQNAGSNSLFANLKSWAWWGFKKGGNITWILSTTMAVVVFPLVLSLQFDVALAEQEKAQIAQWQQQGYTQAQINQMLGMPPQQQAGAQ